MPKKNKNSSGTKLDDLPSDSDIEVDSKELALLNNILNVSEKSPQEYNTLKFVMYASALFLLLSLPFTDRLLELAIPMTQSWLFLVACKTIVFFVLYYIIFYMNKS
jgi:ABC-type uncharacterized transport system YnjBCD permease subunit